MEMKALSPTATAASIMSAAVGGRTTWLMGVSTSRDHFSMAVGKPANVIVPTSFAVPAFTLLEVAAEVPIADEKSYRFIDYMWLFFRISTQYCVVIKPSPTPLIYLKISFDSFVFLDFKPFKIQIKRIPIFVFRSSTYYVTRTCTSELLVFSFKHI